jgi:hypothetical protein
MELTMMRKAAREVTMLLSPTGDWCSTVILGVAAGFILSSQI